MKTIKAPHAHKKNGQIEYKEVSGKVALLYVGNVRYRFLLQETPHGEVFLTHYANGRRLGSLTPVKLRHFKSYYTLKNREAAKILIADLVSKHGIDGVLRKLDSAPVVNGK